MTRKTTDDPELVAEITIKEIMAPLDHDAQARVITWATDRYPDKPAAREERVSDAVFAGPLGEPLSPDGAR